MLLNEMCQGLFFGQRTVHMPWFISAWLKSLLCQNRVASSIHPFIHPSILPPLGRWHLPTPNYAWTWSGRGLAGLGQNYSRERACDQTLAGCRAGLRPASLSVTRIDILGRYLAEMVAPFCVCSMPYVERLWSLHNCSDKSSSQCKIERNKKDSRCLSPPWWCYLLKHIPVWDARWMKFSSMVTTSI